jgi:cation transport ATPase
VKHFRNIPMADMELVLPEKKNPGLTPMDWVKLLISAVVGLVSCRCVFHSHVLFGVFEQCIIMKVLVCLELTQSLVWSAILQFLWSFFFSASLDVL